MLQGIKMIKKLNDKASGRIVIMPGGGINEMNAQEIIQKTGCSEFHMSGKVIEDSKMNFRNHSLKLNGSADMPEYGITVSDVNKILEVRIVLH